MKVDGTGRKMIRLALLDAFPAPGQLKIVVDDILGVPLQNISLAPDMPQLVHELIVWAEARGRLTELLIGAASENPGNETLQRAVTNFSFFRRSSGTNERIVTENVPFENIVQWLDKLSDLRKCVCRFEPQPPDQTLAGYGTAFLVATDIILTNYHVAGNLSKKSASTAVARFDYEIRANGHINRGREIKLADDWHLASDPGLDYILVRLRRSEITEHLKRSPRAAFIELDAHQFTKDEPVVILQHPQAEPLKLAFGTIRNPVSGSDVRYSANTEPGSSGSPVMTSALKTAALHRDGSHDANIGTPISSILMHLEANNKMTLLN